MPSLRTESFISFSLKWKEISVSEVVNNFVLNQKTDLFIFTVFIYKQLA